MLKVDVLNELKEIGLVAVVRGDSKEETYDICKKLIKGGIKALEITFTVPNANELISQLINDEKNIVIGAGTVLDETTARIAIMSGAKFIVGPIFDKNVAKLCNLYQIPYIPGCMTINEIKIALEYGADIIKLFPSNVYKPNIIKSIKAPLPQVNIMTTGGIDLSNMKDWINAGVLIVGVGGNLVKGNDIEKMAFEYMSELNKIRGSK